MTGHPVFLYDGDCAFCSSCAEFIERRMRASARVQAWQEADIDALGLTVDQCDAAVQWVAAHESGKAGPDAVSRLLRTSAGAFGLWKAAGWVLATPPVRLLAWPAYRWVARNRHRMPGGSAVCALPQAQRGSA